MQNKILVIRHGALGDFILSTGPMRAIREHHKASEIVLLTKKPYDQLAAKTPYFDEIWVDERPGLWNIIGIIKLARKLRSAGFFRVYDLQTSKRSSHYLKLFSGQQIEWSGIAKGASHRHDSPERTKSHTIERQKEQLRIAGLENVGMPDLSWLKSDIAKFRLPEKFALIVAGCSPHRLDKRWTTHGFAEIARALKDKDITPVFIGTAAEEDMISKIISQGGGISLVNKTTIEDIAELARNAKIAIGNDTGPMHIIAAVNCPSLMLFSASSKPELAGPRGNKSKFLQKDNLSDLTAKVVMDNLESML